MPKKKVKSPRKKPRQIPSKSNYFWRNGSRVRLLLGVLVITFLIFSPSLQNDFVNWDDPANILENPNLRRFDWLSIKGIFSDSVLGNYNPLTILTFAIEKVIFGLNPFIFHLNNILLHLICVFLIYRIALQLKLSPIAAGLVALLFGIHPMRVESVTWITERKDVLFGAFYLGALYQYIRFTLSNQRDKKVFFWILGLFFLSLLSKIQAVSLPLSFLAIDYLLKRPLNWKLIWEKTPYFLLSLIIGLIGVFLLSKEGSLEDIVSYTPLERLSIGAYSYVIYLIKFIYPYEMLPIYPYQVTIGWQYYTATIFLIPFFVALYYAFKKQYRWLVFSIVFFTFNIMFMLQILGAGQGLLADRFTYIPYLGLFFGVGYAFQKFTKDQTKPKFLQFGMGAYLLLFAFLTWKQTKIWKNGESLWTHALINNNNIMTPWANRADYYQDTKNYDKAIADYKEAIVLNPKKTTLYNSLGKTYSDMGNVQKALENYNIGINLPNPFGEIYINRGVAYASLGQYDVAMQDINKGLSLDSDNANGYLNRGLIYYQLNQLEKTITDLEKYFSYRLGTAEQWFILGLSYRNTGNTKTAIPAFSKAIQINPSEKRYYTSRANAYKVLGLKAEAVNDLEMVQKL